jgi:hypothetical protein
MMWGFGASFNQNVHRFLDTIFRDLFAKLHIPTQDTVYQYYYNTKEMTFKPWKELIPEFPSRIEPPYDSLYVPTIDSVCYTKILS